MVEQRRQAVMLSGNQCVSQKCSHRYRCSASGRNDGDSRAQCVSVHIHVLGIEEFLEGHWWQIRFLPFFYDVAGKDPAGSNACNVQETKAAVSSVEARKWGTWKTPFPSNCSAALAMSIGAIALTIIHKYYI